MASSQTDICNMALLKITRTTITSIDQDIPEAIYCKQYYDHIRDSLLRSHFWNFAKKRQSLQRLATTPAFGYTYQYDLPADYIRAVKLYNTTAPYKIEGKKLLTDDNSVSLIYISKVTDPTQFDALFVEVFSTLLAAELSRPVTGSEDYRERLLKEADKKMTEAKRRDGQEDTPDDIMTETLTNSRSNNTFTASWDLG